MVSWSSRKQTSIALSIAEAKYIVANVACCEAILFRKSFSNLFDQMLELTFIYCDNQSCVKLSKNPMFHDRSKHIEIKYHYIWNTVQRGVVRLKYVPTNEKVVNVLTKSLSQMKFGYFKEQLGVVENLSLREREH